jgi:pyruvate kinase
MPRSNKKTKIVCTIGPASSSVGVIKQMIEAGMNVARLNFSHGDFESHKKVIQNIRKASKEVGIDVAIMADLPGPKMRVGQLIEEPIELKKGDPFTLTIKDITGHHKKVSVSFKKLPLVVKPGNSLFLNDGIIELVVKKVHREDVVCEVVVGGELRSRKGLNLPGIDLGLSAFTKRDHEILKFALENGVDAISQSFVDSAADIRAVKKAAKKLGYGPFVIAKIERSRALDHLDEILEATDGIMVARGDLGVETPFERMAIIQKDLIRKAVRQGKPVITATQMLESMTTHRQPTRAEATDVANAILDGTDCVMLSGESAMGKYPVESVITLAKIAASTEPHRSRFDMWDALRRRRLQGNFSIRDLISLSVETVLEHTPAAAVVVPTRTGGTARSITRFRLPVWIAAPALDKPTSRHLQFSYGVIPVFVHKSSKSWEDFTRAWVKAHKLPEKLAVLIQGPSPKKPERNHLLELIELN